MGRLSGVVRLVALQCLALLIASTSVKPTATPPSFSIIKFITYNMETTIYWKGEKNPQNHSITYDVEYRQFSQAWSSFHCQSPWYLSGTDLACLFLTCNNTVLDVYYEVRVRAYTRWFNTSTLTSTVVYNPSENGIPLPISDVNVTARSSTTVVVQWKLPDQFCATVSYCMRIHYHNGSRAQNETISVSSKEKGNHGIEIRQLQPCSEYSFYVTIYQTELCSFVIGSESSTSGPFRITTPHSGTITPVVHVHNVDTIISWSYPERCLNNASRFLVLFKDTAATWQQSNCTIVRNKTTFSCLFLTCASTKDQSYEVNVQLTNSGKNNVLYFHPLLNNIPDQISNVSINAVSYNSLLISWQLPATFCSKFFYCIQFCYNGTLVKLTDIERENQSKIIHDLVPYTKYSFYVETYRQIIGCAFHLSQCTLSSTGPFTGHTLQAAPSSPPVLICGLCDVMEDATSRNGTVKWKLPPKNTWNGLPQQFIIQWQIKQPDNNTLPNDIVWYNMTINQTLATKCSLVGLSLYIEYVVRVRMCNGVVGLCSVFSKEMTIEAKQRPDVTKASSNNLGLYVGLPVSVACFVLILAVLVYLKMFRFRATTRTTSAQLPQLSAFSYENVDFPINMQYSQLSPKNEKCSVVSNDPKETIDHLNEDDTISTTELYTK